MSFIRVLTMSAMALGLAACAETQPNIGADFGAAVRQDVAAQIADPDARYGKTASDGAKAALAQQLYRSGAVIQPSATGASKAAPSAGNSAPQPTAPIAPGPG